MVVKLKKEVAELKEREVHQEQEQQQLQEKNEEVNRELEDSKVEVSKLMAENQNQLQQHKSMIASKERAYNTLEMRADGLSGDLQRTEAQLKDLSDEFERYKVRAHNVLKQQKESKEAEQETSAFDEERKKFEHTISQLKNKLLETNQKLSMMSCDHEELEIEHSRLENRHNKFVQDISTKETGWKQRFEQVKETQNEQKQEYDEMIKLKNTENSDLSRKLKDSEEEWSTIKEKHAEEMERLREEVLSLQKHIDRVKTPLAVTPRRASEDPATMEEKPIALVERSEPLGMDSTELELIDTLSQKSVSVPATPTSPTAAGILEKILSPTSPDQSIYLSPLASPTQEEISHLKSSTLEANKKVDHLTELLRESEANASRLDEQTNVLKDEIRRMERNHNRDESLGNLEYLKNVIIQFLKVGSAEKGHLIPVLSTMLKLTAQEKEFLQEYTKAELEETSQSGWSSYVYSWTSLS